MSLPPGPRCREHSVWRPEPRQPMAPRSRLEPRAPRLVERLAPPVLQGRPAGARQDFRSALRMSLSVPRHSLDAQRPPRDAAGEAERDAIALSEHDMLAKQFRAVR